MPAALDGLRVIELANYVAGPFAGGLLGDLGADVVKIEAPPHGDPYRNWTSGGYSSSFCSLNRNKKSIVLDLRDEKGLEVALALAKRADILIENARPGAMDRLGLGYGALRELNPRLVYCSITGFGQTGPYSSRPGYDTVGQAMSGLLSLVTDYDAPQPMGISLSDHIAGLYGCYAAMAGLAARERTGEGQHVQTSLLQSSMSFISENMARFLEERKSPPSRVTRTRTAQVYAFKDRDGKPFVIHLSSPDKFWHGLARAVGRPELIEDPRFVNRNQRIAHHTDIQHLLDAIFATGDREDWLRRLQAEDVPCTAMYNFAEVVEDPQVQHLGMVKETVHPTMGTMPMVGSGVILEATPAVMRPAPVLGEHTQEILAELGFPADFATMRIDAD